MGSPARKKKKAGGKKVRVALRRNRAKPSRVKDWTQQAAAAEQREIDTHEREGVMAKGDLSRHRTIIIRDDTELDSDLARGVVVALRGLYADVDDGRSVRPCTVRRMLRTRLTKARHPVTVGDVVRFRADNVADVAARGEEGVIEAVEPRRGELRRRAGRRIQTIAANVDQAVVVSSAREPLPKPNLIDRYIVAAHAGDIVPVVCMNKIDLDTDGQGRELLARYAALGYTTLCTSAIAGEGVDLLRQVLRGKASVIAGQSGVGKSSLLNAVQPNLGLRTGDVMAQTQKGRHTTSTAHLIRLGCGGYVVDTPGIRSFDMTVIPREEFEAYFVEFLEHVPDCKFPDCTHTHEEQCAVKAAVEGGAIHPDRYRSYVQMFEDPGVVM